MGFLNQRKSLAELQEEDENLTAEVSIAEKKAMIKRLKAEGMKPSHFGFDWARIKEWLKTH